MEALVLPLLKIDLQISTSALDTFLTQLIREAMKYIETEGITLDSTDYGDQGLVRMYAAYLYRERRDEGKYMTQKPLPRMLRYNLNNRLLKEKGTVETNG